MASSTLWLLSVAQGSPLNSWRTNCPIDGLSFFRWEVGVRRFREPDWLPNSNVRPGLYRIWQQHGLKRQERKGDTLNDAKGQTGAQSEALIRKCEPARVRNLSS